MAKIVCPTEINTAAHYHYYYYYYYVLLGTLRNFTTLLGDGCQSQCPRGLRHGSAAAHLRGLRVRIQQGL
jgi:hypothetical protein